MTLQLISFPELTATDRQWIDAIPDRYKNLYSDDVFPTHIVLVSAFRGIIHDQVIAHAEQVLQGIAAVPFTLRAALPLKDAESDYTHLVLVPDEGMSGLIHLRDRLYTDTLSKKLDLAVPFIPGIRPTYARDADLLKETIDALHAERFEISGTVRTVSVVKSSRRSMETIAEFTLS